jgi:hypothetical protein
MTMYERPFVTSRFRAVAGDSIRRRLSLAVSLTDDFTGERPIGAFRVLLKERRREHLRGEEPSRNASGYYCFLDVPNGTYTLIAEPGPATRFYLLRPDPGQPWTGGFERAVTLPLPDPLAPVRALTLTPSTSYPFPSHATLVRGIVDQAGSPASAATVSSDYVRTDPADPDLTVNATVTSRSDVRGNYVLFYPAPDPVQQNIQVVARRGGQTGSANVTIREGRTRKDVDITIS